MAYSFPLTTAQFWDLLPIRELVFDIGENVEISGETEGGEVLTARRGTRLWHGEVALDDMQPTDAAEVGAMLDIVRRDGASFMAYDTGRPGPRADLKGTILGVSAPKLHTVDANNREIRISGLPAGYVLQRYDYLAFSYGSTPTRHALHRVAAGVTANGAGLTPLFEVSPNLRPGWALNASVTLLKAPCKCRIVPGSTTPGRRRSTTTPGLTFRFTQTLR